MAVNASGAPALLLLRRSCLLSGLLSILPCLLLLLLSCSTHATPAAATATTSEQAAASPSPASSSLPFKIKIDVQIDSTETGFFVMEVHPSWAPLGAERIREILLHRLYDGSKFYLVNPGVMVQFGLPGDPEVHPHWEFHTILDDPKLDDRRNFERTVSFMHRGKNTRVSEIFINMKDNFSADQFNMVPFGKVVEGWDLVKKIFSGHGDKPDERKIWKEGNAYLDEEFPNLSTLIKASFMEETQPHDEL